MAEEVQSANGTWIGDYRITRVALSDGAPASAVETALTRGAVATGRLVGRYAR